MTGSSSGPWPALGGFARFAACAAGSERFFRGAEALGFVSRMRRCSVVESFGAREPLRDACTEHNTREPRVFLG